MFKFLRSQAKIFYWVIAATFILFLFLGGLTGRGCQAPGTRSFQAGIVGSVNGTEIGAQNLDYVYRQILAQMRQQAQGRDLNANEYASARQRAWDEVVRSILVDQAIAEYDIQVTDAEVVEVFENSPPPELLANYRDETGAIDMNRYYADLQNPENDWSRAEEYVRSLLPRQKLEEIITADAVITDDEVREEYSRQTGRAVAEYIGVLFADLADEYSPSESEISAWYNSHGDDYQRQAKVQVEVVRFAKAPSETDFADIHGFIQEIRQEIVSGQITFEDAAGEYSEDGSAERGGDLGTFDRNRMVEPFTEAAFSLPVGELSEPVRTRFGYHLIEVLEQTTDPATGEVTEVHARHILLKPTLGMDTLDLLRESAQAFQERVDGETFKTTAEAEAMDLLEPAPFIEGRDIPGMPLTRSASMWAFKVDAGTVSPVFENRDWIYVVRAGETIPAGPAPLDEVSGQIVLSLKKEHNKELARAKLSPAVGEIQMGGSMSEVASGAELTHAVTDTFTVNGNVPDVGYGTDFNKAAIEGTVGQLVPEVETIRGLYALTPLWINDFDQAEYDLRQEGIRDALLSRKRGELAEQWFDERMAAAEIEDWRYATF